MSGNVNKMTLEFFAEAEVHNSDGTLAEQPELLLEEEN